ncbi:mCG140369, isoform CRA_a [Mus musculus]|nr:mCG140369, isoform CRA_a [Mus musculus]EDL20828.1 mCG140369, isoform CRA_a [Mus musculus]
MTPVAMLTRMRESQGGYTPTCSQLRNAGIGKNCLPLGRALQLLSHTTWSALKTYIYN